MRAPRTIIHAANLLPLLVLAASLSACGSSETPPAPAPAPQLPTELKIPDPTARAKDMERVEDWTEAVANTMFDFSDNLRRRDFKAAAEWLMPAFAGRAFDQLPVEKTEDLPLSTRKTSFAVAKGRIVGRDDFLRSIAAHVGAWQRVEMVLWKVKGAEFEKQAPLAGKIRFKITMLGTGANGGPQSLVAWADARVVLDDHNWRLERLELTSLQITERSSYLFTDVSVSGGVAHTSPVFADDKNATFYWNGAASGDVDGDGAFDLFVPSRPKNFLYVAQAQGGFVDRAAEYGVATPAGGTGAVFFDFDNDGDEDLAVADVGWKNTDGSLGGNRLRLYVNDGEGKLVERGAELGFDALCHAVSMTVFDYDGDGWLDVYVANYGREDVTPNDSWTDAHNGSPDVLLRNVGGKRFEDVTKAVGIADTRWSYACAAADYDLDGDQDLVVANDYGTKSLWRNDGGKFVDVASQAGIEDLGNGMGATWGDLDGDGVLDLYASNMSSTAGNRILGRLAGDEKQRTALLKMASGNSIFFSRQTDAGRVFERNPSAKGGVDGNWAWSAALADFDLDGRLDVFCANGFITGAKPADT